MGQNGGMRTITTAAVTALLLTACSSGPSEGDRVACETVIDAENTSTQMVQEVLAADDPDRAPLISHMRGMPDRISEARSVAESPELRIALDRLHRVSDFDLREDEEIGIAYQILLGDVERKCHDAGVDVERQTV